MHGIYPNRVFADGNISINAGSRMSLGKIDFALIDNRIAGDECYIPMTIIVRLGWKFLKRGFPLGKFLYTNNIITIIINIIHNF